MPELSHRTQAILLRYRNWNFCLDDFDINTIWECSTVACRDKSLIYEGA
jgi:hypothetical protein